MFALDHVGLIVPRLDEAASLFRALGFTLTERAEHTRVDESGERVSAGSAQHSVMLENGYIELQEITDPHKRHLLSPAAEKYFGLHILAFGVADAEGAQAAVHSNGLEVGPVLRWGRAVHEPDSSGEARFAFFVASYDSGDEALLCWTEHLTPELIRSPRLVKHANGARALGGLVVAARDEPEKERLASRYVASGGVRAPDRPGDILFGAARISIVLDSGLPGPTWPHAPVVRGLVLRLDEPLDLARRAQEQGLTSREVDGAIRVDLSEQFGITLIVRSAR